MSNPENLSFRSLAARFIVDEAVQRFKNSIPPGSNLPIPSKGVTNPIPKQYIRDPECEELPVCIIGAGIAGLYTAMMLDSLGKKYEIIEASPRCGGRAFTHHFTETETFHDYFDLGAMRFPRIKIMDIAFKLFEKLHLDRDGKVIRYIVDSPNNIQLFNGHKVINKGMYLAVDDPFHVGEVNGGDIPSDLLEYLYTKHDGYHLQGADALFEAVLAPFKLALINDPKAGWHRLMQYDALSMRGYLLQNDRKNLPFPGTNWMETMKSSTGAYDLALSETVLDSLDFDYPFGPNNPAGEVETWSCIDGGASVVTDRMCEYIKTKPVFNRRVVGIRMQDQNDHKSKMFVKVKGHPEYDNKPYSHVIATPPIPCLRSMDMSKASLSYAQKHALRCLNYGAAIKVGIKFKTRWWQAIPGFEQIGGVSNTDRPSRVVVYPSYGLEDPIDGPGVLIASYAWTQDASRLGSLVQGKGTKAEEMLLDIVYEDLAAMHGKTAEWYKDYTLDYYAHDWYHDEYTMGAFAQFGPGQFKYLYPEISRPAARGNLHFAGEATSTHRAWIAGALDSATRAVYHLLLKDGDEDRIKAHLEEWGVPEEIETGEQAAWQVLRSIYGD